MIDAPKQSGWYVVEHSMSWVDENPALFCVFVNGSHIRCYEDTDPDGWWWENIGATRYTGPLDLEQLLNEGGER